MMTDNYHIVLKAVPQSDGDACSMRELFPNAEERFERVRIQTHRGPLHGGHMETGISVSV